MDNIRAQSRAKPRAKSKAFIPGTRRTLTAEQHARKRAHDREAQRAIRQRTRQHIDSLENRIAELLKERSLESQIQDLEKRNAQLEEELAHMRQKVSQANSDGSSGFINTEIPYRTHHGSRFSESSTTIPRVLHNPPVHEDHRPLESSQIEEEWFPNTTSTLLSDSQTVPSQLRSNSPMQRPYHPTGYTRHSNMLPVQVASMHYNNTQLVFPTTRTFTPPSIPRFVLFRQPTLTVFETPNPVEGIISGIIQRQMQILSEGADMYTVLGPERPDLSVVLSANRAAAVHPLARALAQATRFATFAGNFERIALAIPHYPLMKWQITQTYETFMDVPWFFVPTEVQTHIPHPVWMDFLFWPHLRDAVILNQGAYDGFEFINIYCNSLNPNWPHNKANAVYWDEEGLHPNDELVMHCLDLNNWTVDRPFQLRYPNLQLFCRFTQYH